MSKLEKEIDQDIISALKEKDASKVEVLRFLKAAIKEKYIQNKKEELKDDDIVQVIKKRIKQTEDSIEAFKKGSRDDLVKKEEYALSVLKEYLPPQASHEEIKTYLSKIVDEIKPQGKKDFGRVMNQIMQELKGKADGKIVSQIVNKTLSELEKKDS